LYVKYWTLSWLLYDVSLVTLLVSFLKNLSWPYALFQIGELGSVAMITAAGMNYSHGFRLRRRHVLMGMLPILAWSISSTWTLDDFNGLYMLHSFLMAGAFAYSSYVFFASPHYRHNVGTRIVAFICLLISLNAVHYAIIFGYAFRHSLGAISYLQYTSFYDLLMQYVLAIGVVAMGMQETQHQLRESNAQLQEAQTQLRQLAQIDPLTGVFNRHAFHEICNAELAPGTELSTPHTLVLLDIDNLKKINDLAGHSMGDEVLRTVAQFTARNIRGNDCLVRWGGDEFLLLMRQTPAPEAERRLVELVEQLKQQSANSPAGRLFFGISYGVAQFRSIGALPKAIEEADQKMYRHKQSYRRQLMLI
jgi:diguanylate cyclase (GGDEF)-like protein